jgi:hypothetical protein
MHGLLLGLGLGLILAQIVLLGLHSRHQWLHSTITTI